MRRRRLKMFAMTKIKKLQNHFDHKFFVNNWKKKSFWLNVNVKFSLYEALWLNCFTNLNVSRKSNNKNNYIENWCDVLNLKDIITVTFLKTTNLNCWSIHNVHYVVINVKITRKIKTNLKKILSRLLTYFS